MLDCNELVTTLSLRPAIACAPVEAIPSLLTRFEVGRYLGGGGMGVVFEGRHVVLDRKVALKFIRPELKDSFEARMRLLREARAMALVSHPNVVTLFELATAGKDVFLAMELVPGGTLRDWLQSARPWTEIIDMFCALGRGLERVHAHGLVHRDVNPSNVFIDRDGAPKLGDFGVVRDARDDEPITAVTHVLGTPPYMAPEQLRGGPVDARADQFAFSVSLHEALAGELPDEGGEPRALPRSLHAPLSRGLAADPDARFATMTELLAALADAR